LRNFTQRIAQLLANKLAAPKNPGSLTFYRRADAQVGWNIKSADGEIVLLGEGHRDIADAARAVRTALSIANDPQLRVLDLTQYPHVEPAPGQTAK
jgi:uncharacterized protein YegP (UPF0339 family)